jgi:hypothetical protein
LHLFQLSVEFFSSWGVIEGMLDRTLWDLGEDGGYINGEGVAIEYLVEVWSEDAEVLGVSGSRAAIGKLHVHGIRAAEVSSETAFDGADGLPGCFRIVAPTFGG